MTRLRRTLTAGLLSVTTCLLVACINELPVDMREGELQVELEATPGLVMVGQVDTVELFVELDGVELTGLRVKWLAPDTTTLAVRSLADSRDLEGAELVDSLDATLFGEISYLRRGSSSFLLQFDSVGFADVAVGAVELSVEERWQSVSAGNGHTCAVTLANTFQDSLEHTLRRGGEVFCWGVGIFGALGTGSLDLRDRPARALSDVSFQDVQAGAGFTCGRDINGLLYCWGDNFNGQLGLGNDLDQFVPRLTALGEAFASFDVGKSDQFTCATRRAFGAADSLFAETLCWGQNDLGQLGCGGDSIPGCDAGGLNQPNTADLVAVVDDTLPPVVPLVFSSLSVGGGHACGVEESSGAAYCWGRNDSGQLGQPETLPSTVFALEVRGGLPFDAVSAGGYPDTLTGEPTGGFACGIESGGIAVHCWGDTWGDLPVPVMGLPSSGLQMLSAGGAHACVLTETGEAYCWGDNSFGQLGDGTTNSSTTAVAVQGGLDFGMLSAGQFHTCAITDEPFELSGRAGSRPPTDLVPSSGAIFCWGDNRDGQLGNGTFDNSPVPVRVAEPEESF